MGGTRSFCKDLLAIFVRKVNYRCNLMSNRYSLTRCNITPFVWGYNDSSLYEVFFLFHSSFPLANKDFYGRSTRFFGYKTKLPFHWISAQFCRFYLNSFHSKYERVIFQPKRQWVRKQYSLTFYILFRLISHSTIIQTVSCWHLMLIGYALSM